MCGAAVSRSASSTCSYGFDPTWSLLPVISLTERPPTSKEWPSLGCTWHHRWARFSSQGITKNSQTTRNTSTRSALPVFAYWTTKRYPLMAWTSSVCTMVHTDEVHAIKGYLFVVQRSEEHTSETPVTR